MAVKQISQDQKVKDEKNQGNPLLNGTKDTPQMCLQLRQS
jgi:hypothetical protein